MKNYTLPDSKPAADSPPLPKRQRSGSDLPPVIRYFFPVCALILILKLAYHIPDYLKLPPQSVVIHGAKILSEGDIRALINLSEQTPWLSLDPYELSLQLRNHPWIETAVIHRSVPLTVDVHVAERVPIAYFQTAEQLFLLGDDYKVLERLSSNGSWDLPVIVNQRLQGIKPGDQMEPRDLKRAFQLMQLLKTDRALPLDAVAEIIVSDPFNIMVVTSPKGVRIMFGFENFERKLASLAQLMPLIAQHQERIRYIDLRSIRGATVKYR